MRENNLVTVCEEAGCPNVGECWSQGHATMMIMGEVCTRACTFCNIATGKPPEDLDAFEPGRVAHAVEKLGLIMWSLPRLIAMMSKMAAPNILPRPSAQCGVNRPTRRLKS